MGPSGAPSSPIVPYSPPAWPPGGRRGGRGQVTPLQRVAIVLQQHRFTTCYGYSYPGLPSYSPISFRQTAFRQMLKIAKA